MDPVSALSVAATAVQFADITVKITKRIAVFAALRDATDDSGGSKAFVERIRSHLSLLNNTIQRINEGLDSYEDGLRDDVIRNLNDYMSNINHHGRRLDQLLNRYLPNDDASIPATLLAALKSIASDREIKFAMARINELLPLLTTFLTSMVLKGGFRFSTPGAEGTYTAPGQRHPSSGAIYQVSRHEVQHFVHRPKVLNKIRRLFDGQHTQSPRIVILQGMGGQGKTQLALRYCANARRQKHFYCILWVDASSKASTMRGLEEISAELNGTNQALLDSDSRVAFVRLLDNYDDPSAFDLREYIPKSPLGNVLVTSRSPDTRRMGSMLRISGMTEEEATNLLFKQLDISKDSTHRAAVIDIASRLGYLPLAIDQAGAYMKAEGVSLTDFISHYERSAKDIFTSVPSLWEYTESASSDSREETTDIVAKTVFTTWNLSFKSLRPDTSTGRFKATVHSLLAFFDAHEISEEYFQAYYSTSHPIQTGKGAGQAESLTRKDTKYAVISLHPLVRDWINLRQERSVHKANFATFTQLLVAVLLPEMQYQPSFKPWFKHTFTQSYQHKSDLHPTVVTSEHEEHLVVTASELIIAMYLFDFDPYENNLELSQWIWDSCDVVDSQMLRVKFDAGKYEIYSLSHMGLWDEAKRRVRDKLQYWKTIFGDNDCYDDMHQENLSLLITLLLNTPNPQDKREAVELCKKQLERLQDDKRNMARRHELLTGILWAAHFLRQYDIRDATLETVLNEAVRCDGSDSWKKFWTLHVWQWVVSCVIHCTNDSDVKDQLSLAALEWAANRSMTDYFGLRMLRALALSKMGLLAEGEAMIRDCISESGVVPFNHSLFLNAYSALGDILHRRGRHEEAYEAYNTALLQVQGPELQISTLYTLYKCACAAEKFNLELADVHLTSRLSFAKKTDHWVDIIRNIMHLYDLVEGCETMHQMPWI
ncbi:hypothetical protein K449DRAFT_399542 [Hypoxylon sp. EC38]|nr:hypothetical protein K449DRAFT_399542 [Hypoxylon sp. EC38]